MAGYEVQVSFSLQEKGTDMTIRSATMLDTEKITAVHKASIEILCSECYAPNDIAGWVEVLSPGIYENAIREKVMIVAEDGDEILGLGILDLENKEIRAVYVHPRVKGMGIGKRLLLELEANASENNVDRLTLCSTINALGFYKHHGYTMESKTFHELPNGVKLECIRMHKAMNIKDKTF